MTTDKVARIDSENIVKVPWNTPTTPGAAASTESVTFGFERPPIEELWKPYYLFSDDHVSGAEAGSSEASCTAEWNRPIPGLVGQIAYYIYQNAYKRNPEVAIVAALALLAGICGRSYNWNGVGLNQYFILLAMSGQGKEDAEKGISKLLSSLVDSTAISPQQIEQIVGPSQLVSAAGLINALRDNPCFVSIVPEVGKFLQKLLSKYARANEALLSGLLLDLYSRSGRGNVLGPSAYSDRAKNGTPFQSPTFTLFGVSTPQEFYKAIDESNIGDGLVSRFTVIECPSTEYIESNHNSKQEPSQQLKMQLAALIVSAAKHNLTNTVTDVGMTPEVAARFVQIDEKYGKLAHSNRDKTYMLAHIRVALRTMKTAALLAVGVNHITPIITTVEMDWAEMFANNSAQTIINRFEAGKVGEPNPYIEQHEQLMNCLKRYVAKEWTPKFESNYGIPEHFKAKRLVTYKYIKTMLHKQPAFRNSPNPKMALDNIIQTFEKAEHLKKIEQRDLKMRGKSVAEMWAVCNLRE
jgi:hypothetical protein